jgi:hypothetical protein
MTMVEQRRMRKRQKSKVGVKRTRADVAFEMLRPFETSPAVWTQALLDIGGRSISSTAARLGLVHFLPLGHVDEQELYILEITSWCFAREMMCLLLVGEAQDKLITPSNSHEQPSDCGEKAKG